MSTKGNVLKALEENRGTEVSGEDLANRFHISRAAIWKAIQELRREGHQIDAITNKGYSLAWDSDVISAEGILPHVEPPSLEDRVHVFKSVDSTNLTAKKMALDGAPAGTVVVAEEQAKGRGRMGRSFYSPPSGGIYMSFILKPRFDAAKAVLITTAASVAVCRAIEKVTGLSCRIKWVNDIYLGEKKICGILTEAVTDFESGQIQHIVLGIGINYSTVFPQELSGIAGSLYDAASAGSTETIGSASADSPASVEAPPGSEPPAPGQRPVPRNRLIAEVINQVLEINERLEARDFIEDYKKRSFVLGKEILILPAAAQDQKRNFPNGKSAVAVDIDGDGGLVVRYPDGSTGVLNTGEISIRTVTK